MDDQIKQVKQNIIKLIKENDMTVKFFVEQKLGMSRNGFYAMLNSGSLKLNTLLSVSKKLNIEPTTLFTGVNIRDKFINELIQKYADAVEEIKRLKESEGS